MPDARDRPRGRTRELGDYEEFGTFREPPVVEPLLISALLILVMTLAVAWVLWTLNIYVPGSGAGIIGVAVVVGFFVALPDLRRAVRGIRNRHASRLRVGGEGFQIGRGSPMPWSCVRRLSIVDRGLGQTEAGGIRIRLEAGASSAQTIDLFAEDYDSTPQELGVLLRQRLQGYLSRRKAGSLEAMPEDLDATEHDYVVVMPQGDSAAG